MSNKSLYDKISDIPLYTTECHMKRNMLIQLFGAQLDYLADVRDVLFMEHNTLCGDTDTILFDGRKYKTSTLFGYTTELHPSLHVRMAQWIVIHNTTSNQITLLTNYLSAVMLKGKWLPNALALLDPALHASYLQQVEDYQCEKLARCWLGHTTIPGSELMAFHQRHAAPINAIKILQLNLLTI